ncbi:MAG: gamma-glutamylcyclotransferase [Alphaproteobacteria bacterium]|nr:gamma-glutamylcyclotransferase [Alphaproteobacteria bacterium]
MRFFFYGTLLDRDVMALVIGRRLPAAAFAPAILPGHVRRRVKGASYPIAVRDTHGEIHGMVVGGLSVRDVARLSAYEWDLALWQRRDKRAFVRRLRRALSGR